MLQPDQAAPWRSARVFHRVTQVVEGLSYESTAYYNADGAVGEVPRADGAAGIGRGLAAEDGGDLGYAGFLRADEGDDYVECQCSSGIWGWAVGDERRCGEVWAPS